MSGTLFVVGTPIGNLGDLTERARQTLDAVDVVAAEDTRRSGRLLARLGISKPLVSFFEGNEERRTAELVERLGEGDDVALVTDAGTPGVSDPGFRLVRACIDANIPVTAVPGPSAAIAALVVSGLPTDRFAFEGFLPRRAGERRARLAALADDPRTLVLFEAPSRLASLLTDALAVMGDRRVAVARELTKLHEEVVRGRFSKVLERFATAAPRGEIVVVVEGAPPPSRDPAGALDEARGLVRGGARKRDAAADAARRHGVSVNEVYRALLEP
ncbi:MAG TPA: 16S rRNA (cytidine(1402)-2'-O)-methyltransferase [Actinomycetota bacterium]|nr:16S rRNA (cytidine(1402)-2'-O)-methyltransferase [Actinomycetota bacterium]